jgi:hypothetical protein
LSDVEEPLSWQEALAEDPAYYMDTEQGKKELAEMIRKESERLLEELGRSVKRTREVIWLSRFCSSCRFHEKGERRITCHKWNVRIVKPFYGKVMWSYTPSKTNPEERVEVIRDIEWNRKWREISETVVEWAIDHVNGGLPYYCYEPPS